MKYFSRNGVHLTLLLVLLFALISAPASVSQASEASSESPAAPIESVQLDAFFQPGDPPGVDPALIKKLKTNARGTVSISTKNSTDFASFVRVSKDGDLHPGNKNNTPQGKANGFFAEYGGLFGVQKASTELALLSTVKDKYGATHLTYQQKYKNVPVFAAILQAHLDANNALTAMNGAFVPGIAVNTNPAFNAKEAAEKAIAAVRANPPQNELAGASLDLSSADLSASNATLYVYRDGLIQNIKGSNYLVYEVMVSNGSSVREVVYINAHNGKIVNRISHVEEVLFRRLFEQNTGNQVWQEGDAFPGSLNADQQNIVDFSGDAYYHFFNAFGADSYDGAGSEMQSVNNDPTINCPNANWNGETTNYCNGVTSDDVVAHEWGHAYTEFTHNLIYQWQPGALNEAYSDIWGETVDSLNGKGTDSPVPLRTALACSTHTAFPGLLRVNSPVSIAGEYSAQAASFGPALTFAGLTDDVALGQDAVGNTIPGSALSSIYDACEAITSDVNGKIALVYRGTCNFTVKVKNAQNAGAVGVIVANRNDAGGLPGMGGADPTIEIPSLGVTFAVGDSIHDEIATPVNATLTVDPGDLLLEDSYRWLMGEDSTAFGGAIRDMWTPTCYGDPGKVSDEVYHCSIDDGGGVHSNSGVPNHGYSLLVDGGTYNGQTITALGMTKAAHIYWGAQQLQTPTTNFADHADSLEAACTSLIGQNLKALGTSSTPTGLSGQTITAADCTEVSEMIAAVELRTDPTAQCDFQPLLAQDEPALCSDAVSGPNPVHLETFEDGLTDWTLSNEGVFSGWPEIDWASDATLPGSRPGSAAFAADPDGGSCNAGDGDISGVMRMESPDIVIPASIDGSTRVAFDHYVATEAGFDGGNLKVSVNDGPFVLVPASAYTFNPYNTAVQPTNPLAPQAAFSGTDGGQVYGTWGQSQVILGRLGVVPGDTIRLRYDFGMDGCAGIDGWYVDDVNVYSCQVEPPSCEGAIGSPASLWPPNHKFQTVNVTGVTDPNDEDITIFIQSIFQDEPLLAPDSGNTTPDAEIIGTDTAQLRSERIDTGNGRVYYISFIAVNESGGSCSGVAPVGVPPSNSTTAVGDGALYDSTQP